MTEKQLMYIMQQLKDFVSQPTTEDFSVVQAMGNSCFYGMCKVCTPSSGWKCCCRGADESDCREIL